MIVVYIYQYMLYICLSNNAKAKTNIMTTKEIYTLANETTEAQLNNLINGFDTKEESLFNSLVKMGDSKELALWTVIAEKYNAVEVSEMYNIAYNS